MLPSLSKIFLVIGIVFLVMAGVVFLASRLNLPLGRLPGDIQIQGKSFTCFFPFATSIIISIVLSAILTLIYYIGRK